MKNTAWSQTEVSLQGLWAF